MIIVYGVLAIIGLCLATPKSPVKPMFPVFEPANTINTPGVYQEAPYEMEQVKAVSR